MPVMPRPKDKALKIAQAILKDVDIPENMRKPKATRKDDADSYTQPVNKEYQILHILYFFHIGPYSPVGASFLGDTMKSKKEKKIATVMREYKKGKLKSGSKKGPKVKSRKQAIAIAIAESEKDDK